MDHRSQDLTAYLTPYQNLIQTNCGLVLNFNSCKDKDLKECSLDCTNERSKSHSGDYCNN